VLVRPHNAAVDQRVFVVRVGGQMLKDALSHPVLAQRLNRWCVFFQSPKRSGKSRQTKGCRLGSD
jgi:hypothetical protein